MTPQTDVSTAQSFDAGAFFMSLASPIGGAIAQKIAPTQNTGQPAATTTPNLRATPSGGVSAGGLGVSPAMVAVVAVAGLAAAYFLLRK
jgi:hypothetical protein